MSDDAASHNAMHVLVEKTVLMLALILVALNLAGWMKKREFKYFGETAMYITVGLVTSLVFRLLSLAIGQEFILKDVQLSTSFFYMVLLPPIIFEGGYSVHRMLFFKSLPTILGLAFAGGAFSTIVIAIVMYLAMSVTDLPLSMIEALIFGALISSTDPVTILAMLPPETDRTLYMIIFGESALNDAVAIILYRFFSDLEHLGKALTAGQFFLSLLASAWVFVGSFATGVVTAWIFAKLIKHQRLTHEAETYEVTMMLVFAYSSYLLAEVFGLTGIISVFFTGVTMAHYAKPNMTASSALIAKNMLRVFSTMCDCFIFMYLGMGLLAFPAAKYMPYAIVAAIFAIAAGRLHVFMVFSAQNLVKAAKKIPFSQQVFVWFSGLRGAVAFALAVQILDNHDLAEDVRTMIFGTAIIVIVTTVYGLNLLTPIMIDKLGIATPPPVSRTATATPHADGTVGGGADMGTHDLAADSDVNDQDSEPINEAELTGFLGWLYRFDRDKLRPFLTTSVDLRRITGSGGASREAPQGLMTVGAYTKLSDGIHMHDLTGDDDVVASGKTPAPAVAAVQPVQATANVMANRTAPGLFSLGESDADVLSPRSDKGERAAR
ncbi:hypothetical protein AMAG_00466 [Allomyces macrogynus ATCC 38327]|uniref:Cation/H+ exchanger transmembrane domain-containing protein n=1 Tax=Allomyces macrogynus (strain ATCC 38327) TaxID=578462 RepID=A0A0L0RWM0_ALLM3|nr:hypothetical protein AMAG_00466 [Allomyces macrogynus ATCC 38327]|eukprot:KNE54494.1 hypothetical protein AMAG_00466 [Allomyces macrogynus ATCC 38327]